MPVVHPTNNQATKTKMRIADHQVTVKVAFTLEDTPDQASGV
jgi:flavin-binding protein dodecin